MREPICACIAYGLGIYEGARGGKNVLVIDWGNSLNISQVLIEDDIFDPEWSKSFTDLGGECMTMLLVDQCCNHFWNAKHKTVKTNPVAFYRLLLACEQVKRELSRSDESRIELESFIDG